MTGLYAENRGRWGDSLKYSGKQESSLANRPISPNTLTSDLSFRSRVIGRGIPASLLIIPDLI